LELLWQDEVTLFAFVPPTRTHLELHNGDDTNGASSAAKKNHVARDASESPLTVSM